MPVKTASPFKRLGLNRMQETLPDGKVVYFSYLTPVAVKDTDGTLYVTTTKFSVTTSKHCSQFIKDAQPATFVHRVDHASIEQLAGCTYIHQR